MACPMASSAACISVRVTPSMDVKSELGGKIENANGGKNEDETWGKRAAWCDYTGPVNDKTVFQQFGNLLGIAKKGGHDFLNAQYFGDIEANAKHSAFSAGFMSHKQTRSGVAVALDQMFMNKVCV